MNIVHTTKDYSILFVDDEEKTLKYFSRYFSKDFTILTATNTSDAKAILDEKAAEIGLLISDQRMPVEKGVELLKYSREKYPNIVRLLTTAYSDLGDAIEAVNRGEILRYIPKPWDISFLELEIRHAMRFFLINAEREQLRHEKLNVIQRLTGVNRAKDLIIFSSGLTHIRSPLHAIRALLSQLPDITQATANFRHYDIWELIRTEINEITGLAAEIFRDTRGKDNFVFEMVDIVDRIRQTSDSLDARIDLSVNTNATSIEANPDLIEKLVRILLEQILLQPDPGTAQLHIKITDENDFIQVSCTPFTGYNSITILNIPAHLLSVFYICYHHGGSMQANEQITIRLPLLQTNVELPELESDWQEQIFEQYEVLPE